MLKYSHWRFFDLHIISYYITDLLVTCWTLYFRCCTWISVVVYDALISINICVLLCSTFVLCIFIFYMESFHNGLLLRDVGGVSFISDFTYSICMFANLYFANSICVCIYWKTRWCSLDGQMRRTEAGSWGRQHRWPIIILALLNNWR